MEAQVQARRIALGGVDSNTARTMLEYLLRKDHEFPAECRDQIEALKAGYRRIMGSDATSVGLAIAGNLQTGQHGTEKIVPAITGGSGRSSGKPNAPLCALLKAA